MLEGAIDQIHTEDAERFGLQRIVVVEHAHVHDDVARLGPGVQLQPNADPAVAFILLLEAACGDGGRVGEEGGVLGTQVGEALDHLGEFLVQHLQQPGAADVAIDVAVDVVTDRHVVGRHGLGDRAGRRPDRKESTGHFLARADFDDRTVLVLVEVDREGFLVGGQGIVALAHRWSLLRFRNEGRPEAGRAAEFTPGSAVDRRRAVVHRRGAGPNPDRRRARPPGQALTAVVNTRRLPNGSRMLMSRLPQGMRSIPGRTWR